MRLGRREQIVASVVALVALNVFVCRELFGLEYTRFYGSIEAAYVSIAHWVAGHPGQFAWYPLWYGGIPYANTYPPLLHWVVGAVALASGWSEALAYHAVTALTYCLGPVTLFAWALRLSGSVGRSFAGALLYSVLSPSLWLMPEMAADAGGWDAPRRLHALLAYGEGPHGTAMTLLPLALLALDYALDKRRPAAVYLAAVALAAVVLTNWLGAFALAAGVVALLLARPGGLRPQTLIWAAGIGALAYTLAAMWIPPSNLMDIRHNAQYTVGSYPVGWTNAVIWAVSAAAAFGVAWAVPARREWLLQRWCAVFGLLMAVLALGDSWFGLQALPQPDRYHVEMEMPICLILGWGLGWLAGRYARPWRLAVAAVVLLAVAGYGLRAYRGYARPWLEAGDIRATREHRAIVAFGELAPGQRIAAMGNTAYWLNAFIDNPQLGGGFDQGIVNRTIPGVAYGFGEKAVPAEAMLAWLKIYGIGAIGAGGPLLWQEAHDKLSGTLPELWREADSAIFAVPGASQTLVHVITPAARPVRTPVNALDIEPVEGLLAALDDPTLPEVQVERPSPAHWLVRGVLEPEHLLFVQETYHPGWRATVNGQRRRILANPLGMMTVEPRCDGECAVDLIYDGGWEASIAWSAGVLAWLGGAVWWWRWRRNHGSG